MPGFSEVLGQERAVHELAEELRRGRLNHAYLFEGRRGTGRTTLARALARLLLCHAGTGCGVCKGCKMFAGGSHPDYLEVPREASQLKRGDFVESEGDGPAHQPVMSFIYLKALEGGRKVVLIPDAERMNEAAANAFLKTLEEPPENVVILLTTSARDRLLGTIVSRCRRVSVAPLGMERIEQELLARGAAATPDEAKAQALLAEGSLGEALARSGEGAVSDWAWAQGALSELTPAGAAALAKGLQERAAGRGSSAAEKRAAAKGLLDLLALALRRKLRGNDHPLHVERALAALWTAAEELEANVRTELVLQAAALNIVSALRRPDVRQEVRPS